MNGMRKGMRKGCAAASVAILVLTAVPATAQTPYKADGIRAAELESQALQLTNDLRGFKSAASLYRKAASLRVEGDPQGIRDLIQAGRLYFYVGKTGRATDNLANAGRIALQFGDVVTAVRCYLDAAYAADANGDGAKAFDLATRAQRLARSPLIDEVERSALLARIDDGITLSP